MFLWRLVPDEDDPPELQEDNLIKYLRDLIISYNPNLHGFAPSRNQHVTPFFGYHQSHYAHLPQKLRCGLSFGEVSAYSPNSHDYGLPEDFVGTCINLASRLQKINGKISYCAEAQSNRKIEGMERISLKIRGFKKPVNVYVRSTEFDDLIPEQQAYLRMDAP